MTEFKFRSWDTEDKRMCSNENTLFNMYQACLCHEDYSYLFFMQFTGMQDKYGKDIYDGDIVLFTDIPTGILSGQYEVVNDAGFIGIHAKMSLNLCDIEPHKNIEVIGNIYENPELIKR